MMKLRVAGIISESIVDGPGFRYVIFTQGCPHHCPGCQNPQTHAFEGGEWRDTADLLEELLHDPLIQGVTFSGGEPFCQPEPLAELARAVHDRGKDVFCYTGYTYEQLMERANPGELALLEQVDILVDGRYEQEQRDLTLRFRGSRNQRLIDVAKTMQAHKIVLWESTY